MRLPAIAASALLVCGCAVGSSLDDTGVGGGGGAGGSGGSSHDAAADARDAAADAQPDAGDDAAADGADEADASVDGADEADASVDDASDAGVADVSVDDADAADASVDAADAADAADAVADVVDANDAADAPSEAAIDAGPDATSDAGDGGTTPDACDQALAALAWTFEAGAQGFTHKALDGVSSTWPLDEWQRGATSLAPGGCHGGAACFGTALDQNYAQCERAELRSPTVDLSACAAAPTLTLRFWHYYAFWSALDGSADGGALELSKDGATWSVATPAPATFANIRGSYLGYACLAATSFHVDGLPAYTGTNGAWEQVEVEVPAAMRTAGFRFRFAYATGVNATTYDADTSRLTAAPGWYVDDVSVGR